MKLLIVDEDLHFGRILSSVLGNDGHDVVVVTEVALGAKAFADARPEVLIVAVDAADPRSISFVSQVRATPAGASLGILLLAARMDDAVRRVAAAVQAAQVFVRPFSVLDLTAAVRGLVGAGAPAVAAPVTGPLDLDNTTRILRLWARRANGDLVVGSGAAAMIVTLGDGGPLDRRTESALRTALRGGELDFRPHDVADTGDERALATWIWEEALAAEGGRGDPPTRATIVSPTRLTEAAGRLPLAPPLARLVGALVGPVSLGRLCDAVGVDAQEVARGVATLAALGVVAVQVAPNAELPAPPPRRVAPTHAVDTLGSGASRANTVAPRSDASPSSGAFGRREDPSATRTTPISGASRSSDVFGVRAPPASPPPAPGRDPFAAGVTSGSTASRPASPPPPAARPALAQALRPPPAPGVDLAALTRRLRREADLLRSSDPWTVLSVPHDADTALVQRAGDRMRARYSELARSHSGELKDLAEQILRRVEEAVATLEDAAPVAPVEQPGDDAFRAGLRAMSAGDWATADRRFIAARDQNLDSARNLAHVGWARVHNPEYPAAERTAEGLDLLLLAEQLDPQYADGQYFLAMVLHRRGDDDAARRRVARALRTEPGHVAANALARKLRRPTPS